MRESVGERKGLSIFLDDPSDMGSMNVVIELPPRYVRFFRLLGRIHGVSLRAEIEHQLRSNALQLSGQLTPNESILLFGEPLDGDEISERLGLLQDRIG